MSWQYCASLVFERSVNVTALTNETHGTMNTPLDTNTDTHSSSLEVWEVQHLVHPQPAQIPLSAQQLQRVGLHQPPPVVYDDLSHLDEGRGFLGFCPDHPKYPHRNGGEVVLDVSLTQPLRTERERARQLARVYLHEVAHRLTNESHTPVFAAVCLVLIARYEGVLERAMSAVRFYDFAQCPQEQRAQGFAFVAAFAQEHFQSSLDAQALAKLAHQAWSAHWHNHLNEQEQLHAPARRWLDQHNELVQLRTQARTLQHECSQQSTALSGAQAQLAGTRKRLNRAVRQLRQAQQRALWCAWGYLPVALGVLWMLFHL